MSGGMGGALLAAGMSGGEAEAKALLFERAGRALTRAGGAPDPTSFFVPGRLEVLGKHTDYAGGSSLLCAVERGVCLVASPRTDNRVRILDVAAAREVTFPLDPELVPRRGDWTNYPMTVGRRIARNFPTARRGADLAFVSDLPVASGLSSSTALTTSFFLALAQVNALPETTAYTTTVRSAEDLAGYLATIENGQSYGPLAGDRGVGTFGGSEDHTAILCCRPGQISQYAFCPVRHLKTIPFSPHHTFVIAVSGVVAEKTGNAREAFNRMSLAVAAILDRIREVTGRRPSSLAAALADAGGADELRRMIEAAPPTELRLLDRLDHFALENGHVIPNAVEALEAGRLDLLGPIVDRSQAAAENLLGNQVPETIALARLAREAGALAASAFGAGFGGGVWALVATSAATDLARRWSQGYARAFPDLASRASFFAGRPGPPALYPFRED